MNKKKYKKLNENQYEHLLFLSALIMFTIYFGVLWFKEDLETILQLNQFLYIGGCSIISSPIIYYYRKWRNKK